jgi:hypothetical protein
MTLVSFQYLYYTFYYTLLTPEITCRWFEGETVR